MLYAINVVTLGLSQYTGLSLFRLVEHGGALYGVMADGLEEFTLSDDNGAAIAWKLETGLAEHGSQRDKGFARAYVRARAAKRMRLTALVDRDGRRAERACLVPQRGGDEPRGRTVKLPRGLRGAAWGWRLEGIGGGEVLIEGIELLPVLRARRR